MLITRCPQCGTTFRVRPEQLTLRGGRVRCGHCHVAFSALSSLEEVADDEAEIVPPQHPATASKPVTIPAAPPTPSANSVVPMAPAPSPTHASSAAPSAPASAFGSPSAAAPASHAYAPEPVTPRPVAPVAPQPATLAQAAIPSYTPTTEFPAPADTAPEPAARSASPPSAPEPSPQTSATTPAALTDSWATETAREPVKVPVASEPPIAPDWEIPDFDLAAPDEQIDVQPLEEDIDEPASKQDNEAKPVAVDEDIYDIGIETEPPPDFEEDVKDHWTAEEEIDLKATPRGSEPFTELSDPTELFGTEDDDALARERLGQQTVFLDEEIKLPAKRRSGRGAWWLACIVLLATGVIQAAFAFRTELAKTYPQARPWLERACNTLGCRVLFPRDANEIVVESTDLNPDDTSAGSYRLIATLRNKADYPQAWPNLELTLTDRFDRALSRRVLTPQEWLPPGFANKPAFDARGEITANVGVATNLPAAGYRLYAFYP